MAEVSCILVFVLFLFSSVILLINSSCSSVSEFTQLDYVGKLMQGIVNEGVGCDLKHSLSVSTLNSRYIAAGYFLESDKYYPECTVLMENSMLLSKCCRFFTAVFNSVVPSQRGSKSLSRTFLFTIPGWWNDLPTPIRNAGSLAIFKQQLKTQLFQHYLTTS